jgi:flagellar biogenesis protein FliO
MRVLATIIALSLFAACPAGLPAQSDLAPASPALKPHNPADRADAAKKPGGLPPPVTVGASLALVLGVFFLVVWALRRASPNSSTALPEEVLEMLGRAPLPNRQQVLLLRCGNRLLLVSAGATHTETLAEITDPAEVDRLTDLCRQARPCGPAAAFRQVFRHKENRDG